MTTKVGALARLCLIFPFLLLVAFIPRDEDPLNKLVNSLQKWTDTIPQEKIYLHMDKPYYALGDTIWFKGYLTIGSRHQLSALSGAMYVDLISEKDSILQQLKLPVTSGMVIGNFMLKDDYLQGSYRIRAYTQWMRNAGEDYFYDHTFLVGDIGDNSVLAKADFNYKTTNGKSELSALLNYTHENGSAWAEKDIRYEIIMNNKPAWRQNSKTDALGSLNISIPDEVRNNAQGAHIHTILQTGDKYPVVRDFPIKAQLSQSDVQFFAESGSLVNGITSRVAFKAVGIDGLGIAIAGTVTDATRKEVAKLETLHAGMGSFLLKPVAGQAYTANIIFQDGSTKNIPLPKAADQGYVLSVYQPGTDSVLVRIQAPIASLHTQVSLIAQTSGEILFSSTVKIEKPISSIWLDKKAFPSGIAQFTLFNNQGEPLNERIAFIRSNDQMLLDVSTAQAIYHGKGRVHVELNAKNSKGQPTFGNFSVSVIDESKLPMDENKESTIFSNLLLTSDLKGYIEQPNYYFAKQTDEVNRALDNLMLTQGYRRFSWKGLDSTVNAQPQFKPEGLGTVISGRALTLNDKPAPVNSAKITMISLRAGLSKFAVADSAGRFSFDPMLITDSLKFSLQARTAKGSDKVKLVLDTIAGIKVNRNPNLPDASLNISTSIKQYLESGKKEDDAYEKLGLLDKVHRLREVQVKAKKKLAATYTEQGVFRIPEGHADKTFIFKDRENCALLASCLQGQLGNVRFQPIDITGVLYPYAFSTHSMGFIPMRIILDGRLLDSKDAIGAFDGTILSPSDIVKIDVVNSNMALMTSLVGAETPVMLIYTNRGFVRGVYSPSIANIIPKGFNKVREFYSPRYDHPNAVAYQPDTRSTIYWNPYLKTNTEGKTDFDFFNADGPGTYKVTVEGINADGELGHQVFRYTVDDTQIKTDVGEIQPIDSNIDTKTITARLDSFRKVRPLERIYLHTDKPYYNISDTIWFKSYVLNDADLKPTKTSGLLYVELANDSSEVIRRVAVRIKNGIGRGQIPLPKILFQEGGYTLRAYTRWLENFGEDHYFHQRFYMGLPAQNSWLVKINSDLKDVDNKNQLQVNMQLQKVDNLQSPVALRKVDVRLYDDWHYLYNEELQTGIDGTLHFSYPLARKTNVRTLRVQVTGIEKEDRYKRIQIPLSVTRGQNIDLQFLPEGGQLVSGLKSTVGFKAIGEDGKGIYVAGAVFDSKGNKVVEFITLHNGMGAFEFTPQAGEKYTAKITQPFEKVVSLPQISPKGVVMHIDNPENGDNLIVSLAGLNSLQGTGSYFLFGTAKNVIYYSEVINIGQSSVTIAKKLFPTGIARFTLFHNMQPLSERSVFIDKGDKLMVKITPDKARYNRREKVGLNVEVKDKDGFPVRGNFSLAVTDDMQINPDSLSNLGPAAGLLLNSELRGYVESPGYYLNHKNKQAWQALDNLLLTQGWVGYNWYNVFSRITSPQYAPETEFKVTGHVTNIWNSRVSGVPLLLASQKPNYIRRAVTDNHGQFVFDNLPVVDSPSFFIQGLQKSGKARHFGDVAIDRFGAPYIPSNISNPLIPWYVNTDSIMLNSIIKQLATIPSEAFDVSGILLREVKIKGKKVIPNSMYPYGPGNADYAFDENDIKKSGATNLYDFLRQSIPNLRVVRADTIEVPILGKINIPVLTFNHSYPVDPIQIDGGTLSIDMDVVGPEEAIEALSKYQMKDIVGVEMAYSRKYTNRQGGFLRAEGQNFAKIQVTTRNGDGWRKVFPPGVDTYRPVPVVTPKEFYNPRYDVKTAHAAIPDYRTTLYWNPDVITDATGHVKLYFYASDIPGGYTVKIAGIDGRGNITDSVFKINQPIPHEKR